MPDDRDALIGARLLLRPKILIALAFLYIVFAMSRVCLIAIVKLNAATVMSFPVHCWAVERLYQTALLSLKDRG